MELNLTTVVTVIGSLIGIVSFAWNIIRALKQDDNAVSKEVQDIKIRIAVLEERSNSEIKLLNKLEEKLDDIEDKL